jgi:hypothetical protein
MEDTSTRNKHTGKPGNGGRFDSKRHDEAGIILDQPPAMIRVRLEAWEAGDNLLELETIEFDGRALLDAIHLDEIDPESNEEDSIFFDAVKLGLAKNHDGPFTVDLGSPSVAEYIEARTAAGATEPPTGPPRRTMAQIEAELSNIQQERAALDRRVIEARIDAISNLALADFPDAAAVHMWESEGGEIGIEILDDGGEVLWDARQGSHPAEIWAEPLDLADPIFSQPADGNHSSRWRGIVF